LLGIGWALETRIRSSEDFFLSGRSIPAWIAGLAFISREPWRAGNIVMAASGANRHHDEPFLLVGAIPRWFRRLFMMPFYYGSRARSVPSTLKLRFDEKTRALNRDHLRDQTSSLRHLDVCAREAVRAGAGWSFHGSIVLSAVIVLIYISSVGSPPRIYNECSSSSHRLGFLRWSCWVLKDVVGGAGSPPSWPSVAECRLRAGAGRTLENMDSPSHNPMGMEWFGLVMDWGSPSSSLLVHGLSRRQRAMAPAR